MGTITLGVIGRSLKENERRLAIHPEHLGEIDSELRKRILLEEGYGRSCLGPGDDLADLVGGVLPRELIVERSDVLLNPKPTLEDVTEMREGQVLCGWAHCVQSPELTQLAIDRRLTVIAWESMNMWADD